MAGTDTTQAGKIIYVSDDIPLQTIIYSVEDVLSDKVYYTEEADRYIKDSRARKKGQQYVVNYLQKIPGVLKDPAIIITDPDDSSDKTILYYKEIYIQEKKKQLLFTLVVKIFRERIIYNFYPQESGKVKISEGKLPPKIIYLKAGLKKSTYFKR
jgi:hypothetical protein